jgi:hypothetical protein
MAVEGSLITALLSAHPDSPLATTYGDEILHKYQDHAHTYAEAVKGGGVTMRPEPGNKPLPVGSTEWYGVGGAADPHTGGRVPETVVPMKDHLMGTQFNDNHALGHILKVEGNNIDRKRGNTVDGKKWPAAYAGGWAEDGTAVMDASSVFRGGESAKKAAVKYAVKRGERAVFDAKNIEDIPTGI